MGRRKVLEPLFVHYGKRAVGFSPTRARQNPAHRNGPPLPRLIRRSGPPLLYVVSPAADNVNGSSKAETQPERDAVSSASRNLRSGRFAAAIINFALFAGYRSVYEHVIDR